MWVICSDAQTQKSTFVRISLFYHVFNILNQSDVYFRKSKNNVNGTFSRIILFCWTSDHILCDLDFILPLKIMIWKLCSMWQTHHFQMVNDELCPQNMILSQQKMCKKSHNNHLFINKLTSFGCIKSSEWSLGLHFYSCVFSFWRFFPSHDFFNWGRRRPSALMPFKPK